MRPELQTAKQTSETPQGVERTATRPVYRPQVDIVENGNEIMLVAEVPGADEGSTDISLDRNVLTIRATVAPPKLEGFAPAHREYEIGDYERAFTISDDIDRERIAATVKDGVLRITLPKSPQKGAQKISVKAG